MKRKKLKTLQRMLALALSAAMVFALPNPANAAAERENPKNPVHHCTLDTTEFSYIYFGSYPQSEVTGNALTDEIINAAYDKYGDAEIGKTKYRRISKDDTIHDWHFGNGAYRYFKWEPIKWRVLQKDENQNNLFIMADSGIDCRSYNDERADITWETCSLRQWLNDDFYSAAFTSEEQNAIIETDIKNEDAPNPDYATEGGNDTKDNIFLLSIGEASNPDYGFCDDTSTYSISRRIRTSEYAFVMGACNNSAFTTPVNGSWWLRSPGDNADKATDVWENGYCNENGNVVVSKYEVCVPALRLNLSSGLWTTSNGDEAVKNPIHNCKKTEKDTTEFNCIYFGSYPQSEVAENALTKEIATASYDENGDAWVGKTKYRRISKMTSSGDTYRYFKWEPIKWRVLENNGNSLFVLSDKGLDCKAYDERYVPATWETSIIRKWLNNDFYNAAFSNGEQQSIIEQLVTNKDNPYFSTDGGKNTQDKVYLLSLEDVTNPAYGFCEDLYLPSYSRGIQPSEYSQARGAFANFDGFVGTGFAGNGWWWLRSPGSYKCATGVYYNQTVTTEQPSVNFTDATCAPALHIKLSSDFWHVSIDAAIGSSSTEGNSGASNGMEGGSSGNTGSKPTSNNSQNGSSKPETSANKPPVTSISGKIKAKAKGFTIKWKKQKSVSGYQIQYSTSKKFTKKTTKMKTVKKANATSLTVKKLKAKKTYYVRIRTYKTANGKQYVSKWSKAARVKTKK